MFFFITVFQVMFLVLAIGVDKIIYKDMMLGPTGEMAVEFEASSPC